MFLACSVQRRVAAGFASRRNPDWEAIIWYVHTPLQTGTASVNHIARTNCEGEEEFLFAPYSAFTVSELPRPSKRSRQSRAQPAEVHVEVAHDNIAVPEDVDVMDWH